MNYIQNKNIDYAGHKEKTVSARPFNVLLHLHSLSCFELFPKGFNQRKHDKN